MCLKKISSSWIVYLTASISLAFAGCSHHVHHLGSSGSSGQNVRVSSTDFLISLELDSAARNALNAVMREHLEAVHQIVEALGKEDFQRAQDVTENQLGMAKHRDAMSRQMPRNFPPEYHDLAMAHHHAAEDLATTISSRNLLQILPALARTLDACVACHRTYIH